MPEREEQLQIRKLEVHEIMSYPVVTVFEEEELKEAASKMVKHGIGSVVVINRSGKAKGIITQGDIVRRFASKPKGALYIMKARELMSKPLVFIKGTEKLEDAVETMKKYKVKKLCVMDGNGELVGIITDNDIMKNAGYLIDVLVDMINTGYVKE